MKIKILIADDHAIVRAGLSTLLNAQPDMQVVAQAKNGQDAVNLAIMTKPNVVIMDLSMPRMDGATATAEIHSRIPGIRILVLTTFGTSDDIARAIQSGADGALMKTVENDELFTAIRAVAEGNRVISPEIRRMLKNDPPLPELSKRQVEILQSITQGLTSKEIADRLGIRKDSVDKHVNALLEKTGASSRAEIVAIALRKQLLKM